MIQITINVKETISVSGRRVAEKMPRLLNQQLADGMELSRLYASGYWSGSGGNYAVPLLPKQKYRRTGRFGAGWKIKRETNTKRVTLSNAVPYARYVAGGANGQGQARIHQGRWGLLKDAIQYAVTYIRKDTPEKLRQLFKLEGFGQ